MMQKSKSDPSSVVSLSTRQLRGRDIRWVLLLAVVVVLFFWKILFFSDQFSILENWERANQDYAWNHFAASSIQRGVPPFWDPYTFSGRPFVGEMQPGLFYPLKLPVYLWRLRASGLLSQWLFQAHYVLGHLLGACFMFFLAREIGLRSGFAAFVAAVCFALGGFVGQQPIPNWLDSEIWLPLIFLFLLRALRTQTRAQAALYACVGGLGLGMSILAGSLHIPIMDGIAVATAAVFFAWQSRSEQREAQTWRTFGRCTMVLAILAGVAFTAGAVQLFPSFEYSRFALRWVSADWATLFNVRIPYAMIGGDYRLSPRSVFALLFGAMDVGIYFASPYFGVMPLVLSVLGVWGNWRKPWVKYLTGLAVLAFFYTLGSYSLLHGLLYLLVPYLDKVREASLFIYLTHFATALLAGFGVETLLSDEGHRTDLVLRLNRVLQWIVVATALILGWFAISGKTDVSDGFYLGLLFLIASWGLLVYLGRGNRSRTAELLLVALIVCDLSAFNLTLKNKIELQRSGKDYLEQLLSTQKVAEFLKSQPGLFRTHLEMADFQPKSMGLLFGVQTDLGHSATMLKDHLALLWSANGLKLLNVRYLVSNRKDRPERLVFTSGPWNVYELSNYCPRAWVVHQVSFQPSTDAAISQTAEPNFDPLRLAYINEPLAMPPEPKESFPAEITFQSYRADRFELRVRTPTRGLLVVSEMYYPGWEATINGESTPIYRTNGALRGVIVEAGENSVAFHYRPKSIYLGGALSTVTFLGVMVCALIWRRKYATSTQG